MPSDAKIAGPIAVSARRDGPSLRAVHATFGRPGFWLLYVVSRIPFSGMNESKVPHHEHLWRKL